MKKLLIICFYVSLIVLQTAKCQNTYEGFSVLRLYYDGQWPQGILEDLKEMFQGTNVSRSVYGSLLQTRQMSGKKHFTDVMIGPHYIQDVKDSLEENDIYYKVLIDNVQSAIHKTLQTSKNDDRDLDTSRYYNLTEIYDWMDEVVLSCERDIDSCHVMQYGESVENRPLKTVHVGETGDNRKYIWLDCGIHAREWIAPAVCNYILERLIVDINDEEVSQLRQMYDWFITPVANVDGYEYTWTTDRLWRKTRSINEGSQCIGTDGNRNYPYQWGGSGASDEPCSDIYRGSGSMSAVEVQAINEFVNNTSVRDAMDLVLTFHSYGQILLYPWAYTEEEDPDDIDDLVAAADVMVNSINSVNNQGYVHGHPGAHSGSSIDWGKGTVGAKYSYLLELRDDGENGFLLPPDQIQPCVEEVWEGVKAMAFHIADL